ncbi:MULTISPECIES: ribbon-helix-helix domain-containing protein [Pontibacillus]|uniref:Ribbon-helix-helix domain-containing protein n=1 Tax=Pontibacillus chungwhensis TaxID=265426 RepID=A0ABY8V3W5_9BACI|nr:MULTISPECIES: ribbon-helix-helix domain-containing protein [Pontibacillus]MCD5326159.1 ribbon-helix-helix domain-containing protein [Pontibacillus sp. HN14]WIG00326.1 ribbon-helix-helix domain-containing protein [Pontibacillus chungwhensis]
MGFEDSLKKKEGSKKRPEKAVGSLMPRETNVNEEDDLLSKFNNKKKVEDTHTRHTFLIDNDLIERLDKLAKGRRGFKKEFINQMIREGLDRYEDKI